MKIIYNSLIPFKGFTSMAFWPFIFVRKDSIKKFTKAVERHEDAHCEQQLEVLVIALVIMGIMIGLGCGYWSLLILPLYYYIYYLEWLIKFIILKDKDKSYFAISHEIDARISEYDELYYVSKRKSYAWVKYMFKLN